MEGHAENETISAGTEETTIADGDANTAVNVTTGEPAVLNSEELKESKTVENGGSTNVEEIEDEYAADDKSELETDEDMLKEGANTFDEGSGAEQGIVDGTSDTDGGETESVETNSISISENIEVNDNDGMVSFELFLLLASF